MGWRAFFLALHITSFFFFIFIFGEYSFVDPTLYADVDSLQKANVLNVAVQLGRLDLASLALTFLGTIIALGAVYGFWVYGHVVERTAKKEAKEIAPAIIAKILREDPGLWLRVIRENPENFKSAVREAFSESKEFDEGMSSREGDDIAAASGGGENE